MAASVAYCVAMAVAGAWLQFVWRGTSPSHWGIASVSAMLALIALPGVNAIRRRQGKAEMFSPAESAAVVLVAIMGTWGPSWAFSDTLMPLLTSPAVYASPENGWMSSIIPHLSNWAMGPLKQDLALAYFNGLASGVKPPLHLWVLPSLVWSLFAVSLAMVCVSLGVMFGRRWVEHDRLAFPHAEVFLGVINGFMSDRRFWIGMAVAAVIPMWNLLARLAHVLRPVSLYFGGSDSRGITWLNGAENIVLVLNLGFLGLSYFVHRDVLLSIVFFYFIFALESLGLSLAGANLGNGDVYGTLTRVIDWQSGGALLAFVIMTIWGARKFFHDYMVRAWTGLKEQGEWISPRSAIAVFAVGLAGVMVMLIALGLTGRSLLVFLVQHIIGYIGLARITAESAWEAVSMPVSPSQMVSVLGTKGIPPAAMVTLALSAGWLSGSGLNMVSRFVQGERIRSGIAMPGKVIIAMIIATGVTTFVYMIVTAYLAYTHGANNFGSWEYQWHARIPYDTAVTGIQTQTGVDWPRLGWLSVGAALMWGIMSVRAFFSGWFLHPVGFLIGPFAKGIVFTALLGWMIKTVIITVGGVSAFEKWRPFFAGLFLGGVIPAVIGFALDPFFPKVI
jgi:hypothetical protein